MIFDKLEIYIKRKELSKKAISEVCEIIASEDYSTDEEIDSLVKVFVKLKSVVLYNFITSGLKVLTKELAEKIVARVDVRNSQKAGHIYCMIIALDRANFTAEANSLLLKFVRANVSNKMSNQFFDGFRQALKYGYDTFLFSKLEGWTVRDINLYILLLTRSAEFLNDSQFTDAAKSCAEKNFEILGNCSKESNEIKQDLGQKAEQIAVTVEDVENKNQEKNSNGGFLSTIEILNLLKQRFEDAQSSIKVKEAEIDSLKAEIAATKARFLDSESKEKKLSAMYDAEHLKLVGAETEIKELKQKLNETEAAVVSLNSKLSNVVSAYEQAGQNEIDSMKENLSRRLASEYRKYLDIKSKEVDIDYYDVLILILDEVFKVLKKNGITL